MKSIAKSIGASTLTKSKLRSADFMLIQNGTAVLFSDTGASIDESFSVQVLQRYTMPVLLGANTDRMIRSEHDVVQHIDAK
jgi:hypothetical protein